MSFQASAKRPSNPSALTPLSSPAPATREARLASGARHDTTVRHVRPGPVAAPDISCFHVVADAHPGTLGRLLAVIAKRGFVPSYVHSVLGGRRGDELAVDLQVSSLDEAARDLVSAQLRAIVSVRAVLTSVKTFAD